MSSLIPAYCPNCGAVFPSRSISGNFSNLTLRGNKESCPFCGEMADTAEGVFDIAGDFISIISAPHITKQMISDLSVAVKKAYKEKITQEKLAEEIGKIDPSFGNAIGKVRGGYFIAALLIILAIIRSCSVDVSIDANQLIDQLTGKSPTDIVSEQKDELYPLICHNGRNNCTHPLGNAKRDPDTGDFAVKEDGCLDFNDLADGVIDNQNAFTCPKCGAGNSWEKDKNGKSKITVITDR